MIDYSLAERAAKIYKILSNALKNDYFLPTFVKKEYKSLDLQVNDSKIFPIIITMNECLSWGKDKEKSGKHINNDEIFLILQRLGINNVLNIAFKSPTTGRKLIKKCIFRPSVK